MHVLRIDRHRPDLAFVTTHALGTSTGLSPLSTQVASLKPEYGIPLAAVNGDYYQMAGRPYAGDARGLQVIDGELLSSPTEGVSFWVDAQGRPHAEKVASLLRVTWPDGRTNGFGINELVRTNKMVLYTSSLGWSSTGTTNACELVLERMPGSSWPPLAIGQTITARVRELRHAGNTPISPEIMVLAVDEELSWKLPAPQPGDVLKLSFGTQPDLTGVGMIISGGPVLVRNGRWQGLQKSFSLGPLPYEVRSMEERHPRTALGWNRDYYFLVQVDGRQAQLSVGMTLKELAQYMILLGCTEVVNFDGGGSSEMWYKGRVINKPCDRQERDISNGLVLVRRTNVTETAGGAAAGSERPVSVPPRASVPVGQISGR